MEDAVNSFASTLVQGLLALAIPVLVAFAVPWLLQKYKEVKQNLGTEKAAMLEQGISMAVRAAEQAGLTGKIENVGKEKYGYALGAAQKYFDGLGLTVDVNELADLMESEVHKQFTNPTPLVDNAETRAALIDKAVDVAVLASQQGDVQALLNQVGMGLLDQNKDKAIDFAMEYLAEQGINLNRSLVEGLIDAHIMKLKLQAMRR
jgi:hypothetical protein